MLHSTTYRSHPRSYHGESPRPVGVQAGEPQALAGQQVPQPHPRQAAPAVSRAQAIVDSSRARQAANGQPAVVPAERAGEIPRAGSMSNHQAPRPVHVTPISSMAVPGVSQIPSEQNHIQISSKNLAKFQIMTLAWILKHGSIVMRWL